MVKQLPRSGHRGRFASKESFLSGGYVLYHDCGDGQLQLSMFAKDETVKWSVVWHVSLTSLKYLC